MKISKTHSDRAHATLSASSSERWMSCAGSIRLSARAPQPKSSVYADEGTAAHELGEKCLREGKNAADFLGKTFNKKFKVTQEMAEAVQIYVDYVRSKMADHKTLLLEQKFSLEWLHAGMFGTNDACVKEDFGTLEIIDYKHGKGHAVDAKGNTQLLYYALGAMWTGSEIDTSFNEVIITIVQPRAFHSEGAIRSWTVTPEDVVEFSKVLKKAALLTEDPNAPLVSGDHCRWCPAKMICPQIHKDFNEVAKSEFTDLTLVPKEEMKLTPAIVSKVLNLEGRIKNLLEACKEYALEKLMHGEKIEGLKLVRGRGSRSWALPEEEIESILLENYSPVQITAGLKTVAQMEKAIGKKAIENLVIKTEGPLTIAPEKDKRAAVIPAAIDFQQIETNLEE